MADNIIFEMLKAAFTAAAEDGKSGITLATDGHVWFGSTCFASGFAKGWIEPEAFKSFLLRVRERTGTLLEEPGDEGALLGEAKFINKTHEAAA